MWTLKRTKTRKILLPHYLGQAFKFWDLNYWLKYFLPLREFSKWIERIEGDRVKLKDNWIFNSRFTRLIAVERHIWKHYIPPFDLKNKVVLDIGAGCGETARFYLSLGASKILCVENDPENIAYLKENQGNHEDIEVFAEDFKLSHIKNLKYDLIKMDIEGYEQLILDWLKDGSITKRDIDNLILETHSIYIIDEFLRLGFRELMSISNGVSILSNIKL